MALRKIIKVEGEAFVRTSEGNVQLGPQKAIVNAYCKITNVSGDKANIQITVTCVADNYRSVKNYTMPVSIEDNAPNFIKQGYLHLKSLPEWAEASDC